MEPNFNDDSSLEQPDTPQQQVVQPIDGPAQPQPPEPTPTQDSQPNSPQQPTVPADPGPVKSPKRRRKLSARWMRDHMNVYLILFIFVVALGSVVVIMAQRVGNDGSANLPNQELTPEELAQISGSDAKVGDPKQQLTIESTTTFTGKVFVKDSIDVAGSLKVGGALELPGITVSGASSFDEVNTNLLAVSGDASLQGQLNVQNNLSVSGSGSFGGPLSATSLTVGSLQLTENLIITRHIDAGGGTPGRTTGNAVGNGGTTSVSGTDTAGTLTVNTGGGPVAGCFATISFTNAFAGTPHIAVTPVGASAAGLNYYINRSTTSLSICSANAAPAGTSFSFDWVAID